MIGAISIHALREESDFAIFCQASRSPKFQSTLSVRRATTECVITLTDTRFQSTLSVRRATAMAMMRSHAGPFSIHALREESDMPSPEPAVMTWDFNPRSP